MDSLRNRQHQQSGFTLMETLVSLVISSLILTAIVTMFSQLTALTNDNQLKVIAQLQAQSVLEIMTPDIRMLGNGVPFHQANFLIAQENLSDNTVTQPILVSASDANRISFRLNETGETYILTANLNPALTNTISLTSVDKIEVEDQIYITNATVGEDDGLWGIVQSINPSSKTITLKNGSQYSVSSTFPKGSLLEVVPVITYTSHAPYNGITRNDGWGDQVLASTGEFTLTYMDSAGDPIELPLLASAADPFPASAIQNLHTVQIEARIRTPHKLSTGEYYTARATQIIGIRNLNYKY